MTPLHYAVRRNHIELVKYFCAFPDIKLEMPNYRKQTPLDIAIAHRYTEIIEILTEKQKELKAKANS